MSECCPCGSGLQYSACCHPYLTRAVPAPTPEALMRSRYTAYVRQDVDYLIATWYPEHHPQQWRDAIADSCRDTHWLGLTVLDAAAGSHAQEGFVEFAARYTEPGRPTRPAVLHERSRFLRLHDRWYYVDGVHLQTGRNARCPCGSGKKYKICCGQ